MNRFFASTGKYCVAIVLALLLASPLKAQVSLREALDFDGDGKSDWALFRPDGSTFYIQGSGGGNIVQPWGIANEDWVAPGDYDGDNRGDIAVWRETNGNWWVLRSSDSTVYSAYWGDLGDEPVQRDYDGDGRTDFAVARRSNNVITWWVLRSDGQGFIVGSWGASDDYVIPGDFDGDGRFDFAIQRPGATMSDPATFWIYGTTAGFMVYTFGIGADLVAPGDYDGDGKTDLAIIREGATPQDAMTWYVLRSSDLGLYGAGWGVSATDVITPGDYDGDGKFDFAIWRDTNATFFVLNSSDTQFQSKQWGNPSDEPLASYNQF